MAADYEYIYEFINKIDVECPDCSNKSGVVSNPKNRAETKFVCASCGKTNVWKGQPNSYEIGVQSSKSKGILIGQPVDCYFKLKLWYKTTFKGEVLFAYNINHLNFLNEYIDDKLRSRAQKEGGWSNSSLQSRLPKWMLKSANREGLIKKINELKSKK